MNNIDCVKLVIDEREVLLNKMKIVCNGKFQMIPDLTNIENSKHEYGHAFDII